MIELTNLTKTFGTKRAVDNLTLRVDAGELFVLLGPNGAGKTTTIKLITGMLHPTAGTVQVGGFDVIKNPIEAKRLLSYIPDEPYLYEKLTAREFLDLVAKLYRIEPATYRARLEEFTAVFELAPFMDTLCETFSHGMKQRVVVTAALLHDPAVIVVDEPMVGLDPRSARRLKEYFRKCRAEGSAIFISTHTLPVAEEIADRIGIMDSGKLIASGTVEELHAKTGQKKNLEELFLALTGK